MTTPSKKATTRNSSHDRPRPQIDKFKEAARQHETDDSEAAFDAMVKKIAKAPPPKPDKPNKAAK